jgi:hypothetical protein
MHPKNLITLFFPFKVCIRVFTSRKFGDTQLDLCRIIWFSSMTVMRQFMTTIGSTSTMVMVLSKWPMIGKWVLILIIFHITIRNFMKIFIIKMHTGVKATPTSTSSMSTMAMAATIISAMAKIVVISSSY